MAAVRVALLGCGVVGTEVVLALAAGSASLAELEQRVGAPVEVVGIAVRDIAAPRHPGVDPALLTGDAATLVARADVVVELIGGLEPARTLLLAALAGGAGVVTANKALLARDALELHAAAAAGGSVIGYEAAVAGAVPIIGPLRDALAGDRVLRVLGIVNGTTNYVLDEMDTSGAELAVALARAQELGYAEADPTADVEGHDAAAKAALLASLAFHTPVPLEAVHREGIAGTTAQDVATAADAGMVLKLLAICERSGGDGGEDGIHVRVHPTLVPRSHPLAGVHGAYNAVFVQAEAAGELMFYGRGAGGRPTSSAVLGDLVAAARRVVHGTRGQVPRPVAPGAGDRVVPVLPIGSATTRCQVRLDVEDRPGVLAAVAGVFAERGVSIETVRQSARVGDSGMHHDAGSGAASLTVTTHTARDADLSACVEQLRGLDVVASVASVLRVEGS